MKIYYYWEDEKIKTSYYYPEGEAPEFKKVVFVPNLIMWLYNHKEIEIGNDYFCRCDNSGSLVGEKAVSKDGLCEYRQIEGIETKEDLIEWSAALDTPLSRMKRSLTHLIWNWANRDSNKIFGDGKKNYAFKSNFSKQIFCDNQELYVAFSRALFYGFAFNNCNPDKVYENVYYYDMSSFYSAIMHYMNFPRKFIKVPSEDYKELLKLVKEKPFYDYYGHFVIDIPEENYNEFLEKYGSLYNRKIGKLAGYFNHEDLLFIKRICKLEKLRMRCFELFKVETFTLSSDIRRGIAVAYQHKEAAQKGSKEKKIYKLVLERLCGCYQKRKTYTTKCIWNQEKRHFEVEKTSEKWKDLNKRWKSKKEPYYEYSVGVWIQSYARLILSEVWEKIGDDALYGDIDSIIFKNKENIEKIRDVVSQYFPLIKKGINLGNFKNEVGGERPCLKLKVLGKKWYAYSFKDESGNDDFIVKCSGAKPEIVKEYLKSFDNPIEMFSQTFPSNVRPYVKIEINKETDQMEYCYTNWIDEEDIGRET